MLLEVGFIPCLRYLEKNARIGYQLIEQSTYQISAKTAKTAKTPPRIDSWLFCGVIFHFE